MATEYKIIKIRRSIESAFVPSNLLPGELHISTDTGKVHYCYSAGNVKQLATIEQLQGLLNVSPEAYIALQQLITELEDETVLSGILADINELKTERGMPLGTATLNENGKVPESQMPSYVDELIEVNTYEDLPATGEGGKIYLILSGDKANRTFRWGGTAYSPINESLALGEIVGTAFEGSRGKILETGLATVNDNLTNKFTTISGTLPDSTSGVGLQVPYPTGFTRTNTMVTAEHWSDTGGRLRDQFYSTNLGMTVALETEYITINARIAEALNRPYRIALMRYDI